jgi:hypothetical protein
MPILKRSRNIAAKKLKLDDQTRFTKKSANTARSTNRIRSPSRTDKDQLFSKDSINSALKAVQPHITHAKNGFWHGPIRA